MVERPAAGMMAEHQQQLLQQLGSTCRALYNALTHTLYLHVQLDTCWYDEQSAGVCLPSICYCCSPCAGSCSGVVVKCISLLVVWFTIYYNLF